MVEVGLLAGGRLAAVQRPRGGGIHAGGRQLGGREGPVRRRGRPWRLPRPTTGRQGGLPPGPAHLPDLRGCTRAAYLEKEPLPCTGFEIRPLEGFFSFDLENYHSFTDQVHPQAHRRRCDVRGPLRGAAGASSACAPRGSVGMLEVLPHRRKRAATDLMALYDRVLPGTGMGAHFSQIFHGNRGLSGAAPPAGWALSQRPCGSCQSERRFGLTGAAPSWICWRKKGLARLEGGAML